MHYVDYSLVPLRHGHDFSVTARHRSDKPNVNSEYLRIVAEQACPDIIMRTMGLPFSSPNSLPSQFSLLLAVIRSMSSPGEHRMIPRLIGSVRSRPLVAVIPRQIRAHHVLKLGDETLSRTRQARACCGPRVYPHGQPSIGQFEGRSSISLPVIVSSRAMLAYRIIVSRGPLCDLR